ncbi:MAG: Gfo/Idh/MocA family oxidoreductase [Candidatus Anammoximicrobium sp.]|nr:Gfo/Idh/MocA family oxidoreductase [Candidatus Anammoximicrobium sp.]
MKRNHSSRRHFLKTSAATLGAAAFGRPLILSGAEAASTAANSRLNLALVGCGGQGRSVMKGLLAGGANLAALCDPDQAMIEKARADALNSGGEATKDAQAYEDYRRLLDKASSFDAVLIGTPDHWHAHLCTVFMKAGKHVYCEKPLTHSVAEARRLRELSRTCNVVTQMGNQGSASASLRRCTEIIRAGALGPIREIYHWGVGVTASEGSAAGEDPVPPGFNWDLWVGPSALRPYKKDVYHPFRWRSWFDFGNGGLADICCHAINLPMRALDLSYPEKIVINVHDGKQVAGKAAVEFHFPARGRLDPVALHWQGSGLPPADVLQPLVEVYKDKIPGGLMILGEKGCIYTSHWNTGGLIRLQGEPRLKDVLHHEATRAIPESLPRIGNHGQEWLDACRSQDKTKTFSDFDTGGLLTEIGLAGVLGLRTGKNLDWDGEQMRATNAPESARFVHTEYRTKWLS